MFTNVAPCGAWVKEAEMAIINTCNLLKLVELDSLPTTGCSLGSWGELV